ncbi:AER338Cp [Eremothecium gossypii ATCC 10895]|uniref:AER338Cp n=1 Tax=Eremothecium gossypii (strain ATCC 10895 / CBS 109.51 / FGSC 9923 / NRRL Y-1056) TaxID=284811 RepID=Q756C9_EREGS|nr:AER338Cp [Eremothecium gossypii ATCC 10895]AAS53018.1 AER338Cp [Eremothecium gossypii ATCC 10895]AEY97326.1 FAER338Cp [Eremothecium gossypii FDAG1]
MAPGGTAYLVLVVSMLLMFLKRNQRFKSWALGKIQTSLTSSAFGPLDRLQVAKNLELVAGDQKETGCLAGAAAVGVFEALMAFNEYKSRALRQNGVIYKRTQGFGEVDMEQLRQIGYFDKVMAVNDSIVANEVVMRRLVEYTLSGLAAENPQFTAKLQKAMSHLGYSLKNGTLMRPNHEVVLGYFSKLHVVTDSINHIVRDYHPAYEVERKPLLEFIEGALKRVPSGKTLLVVPGSGCGGTAWHVATAHPEMQVSSVEFDPFMYLCNEYVLGESKDISLSSFATHYSGQLTAQNQCKQFHIKTSEIKRPKNLDLHLGDFRTFKPDQQYDNIVVISAYFIDTAENMLEYFNSIEGLKQHAKNLHWINAGPLKYGTKPMVQFTVEELTALRKVRGWKDEAFSVSTKELNGYLTNYNALFQGYYGLVKFHSVYTPN